MENISRYLDLTLLNPAAILKDIETLATSAKINDVYAVCVSPTRVSDAVKLINGSGVKVASVVGFPSGAQSTDSKLYEAKDALKNGASEIDMVANLAFIASGDWYAYQSELDAINSLALEHGAVLKVIIETALWEHEIIATATKRATEIGVGYIETSTGYSPAGGASLDAVSIMLDNCGGSKIKASGGIRTLENANPTYELE